VKRYVLFIAIFLLPLLFQVKPLEILKLKTFDAFVETPKESGNFVILNITDKDVQARGGYPFPRRDLAQIHVDLLNAGATGVGWVILFPEPDRFQGDDAFAEALSYSRSVIAMPEIDNGIYPKTEGTVIIGPDVQGIKLKGVLENIEILKANAYQGIVSAPIDVDGLVRQLPLLMQTPDGWVASFGTQVLKALIQADTYILKAESDGIKEIAVQGLPSVKVDNYGRKWISWVDTPQTTLEEMNVAERFVFVGVTAKGIMPQLSTPNNLMYPHMIQAALAESMLIENSPQIPDSHLVYEVFILILITFVLFILINFLGLNGSMVFTVLIFTGVSAGGIWLIKSNILIDVTYSLISLVFISLQEYYFRFRQQFKLRQEIKKQFEHYLDPRQVKRLQDNPELLKLSGEKRYATFLFTDVRGFTSLSERLEPEEVTELMNKALTIQASAVQANGGMVDKYIGDAMMAIFNAPLDLDNHEDAAIKTAIQIKHDIEAADLGIEIGIGLSSGLAVIGNMGSATRFDYTAIGDAVNLGARMESSCKELGVNLVIADSTMKASSYELKSLGEIKVKGKSKPIKVYTWEN
jgi:adenylate cyclase